MSDTAPGKNTYLSLSVVGEMDTSMMEKLYAVILQSGCNVEASRNLNMGELSGILAQLGGTWAGVVRCEDLLKRFANDHSLNIQMSRTTIKPLKDYTMSYAIDIISPDNPGILHSVIKFISQHSFLIKDIHTNSYNVRDSDAAIFTMHATVRVPDDMAIGSFRAEFSDLCDNLNLDAVVEPIKPYE